MSQTAAPQFHELTPQQVVVTKNLHFTRDSLVRYAGASGDFNPIHYRDDVAQSVGLPGVLAHGMLTLGAASSAITEWLGNAGFVRDVQARFTRPVVVDRAAGATLQVSATVTALNPEQHIATLQLQVLCEAKTVLAKALAEVQFTGAAQHAVNAAATDSATAHSLETAVVEGNAAAAAAASSSPAGAQAGAAA